MTPDEKAAERLRTALDLTDLAEAMMRARLRREQPLASDEDVERKVSE